MKERVVGAVVALGAAVPQLAHLEVSHLQGDRLSYVFGKRMVANPEYPAELATYEAELARRAAEPDNGVRRKRSAPLAPQAEIPAWEADGFELHMSFELVTPEVPRNMCAATSFPIPGYAAIHLESTGWDYEAEFQGVRITIRMNGPELEHVQKAIFDALRRVATE